MWAIVDSGLASMTELNDQWTLDDYMEAGEYLAAKAKKEAEAVEQTRRGHR